MTIEYYKAKSTVKKPKKEKLPTATINRVNDAWIVYLNRIAVQQFGPKLREVIIGYDRLNNVIVIKALAEVGGALLRQIQRDTGSARKLSLGAGGTRSVSITEPVKDFGLVIANNHITVTAQILDRLIRLPLNEATAKWSKTC